MTPWTLLRMTQDSATWNSETFAQNQNANAIRFGTLYNFRFDSSAPPADSTANIGFFKTGSPVSVRLRSCARSTTPTPTPPASPTPTPTPSPTVTPTATVTPPPSPTPSSNTYSHANCDDTAYSHAQAESSAEGSSYAASAALREAGGRPRKISHCPPAVAGSDFESAMRPRIALGN